MSRIACRAARRYRWRHADFSSPSRPTAYILYDECRTPPAIRTQRRASGVLCAGGHPAARHALERLRGEFYRRDGRHAGTFETLVWRASGLQPLITFVVTAFAAVAVILMLAGFYAMTVYSLVATRKELAIRLALGATLSARHFWIVLRVYVVGLALGMGLAFLIHTSLLATTALPPGVRPAGPRAHVGARGTSARDRHRGGVSNSRASILRAACVRDRLSVTEEGGGPQPRRRPALR